MMQIDLADGLLLAGAVSLVVAGFLVGLVVGFVVLGLALFGLGFLHAQGRA